MISLPEIIAVIFSLWSVWLTAKNKISSWPIGIVGIIAYFFIFQECRDWANASLQFIFLAQSLYGWLMWNNKKDMKISNLTNTGRRNVIIFYNVFFFVFFFVNSYFNGNSTIMDAATAALSLIAIYLTTHRKWESWILWIIADIIYISLFIENKHYLSSVLYLIFLIVSVYGYIDWRKKLKLI